MINCILSGNSTDTLKTLPSGYINCCVTSPPYYGLRDYGVDGQIGQEKTPMEYIERLVGIFREVRRVLRDDGTLWLNIGDSYAGSGGDGNQWNFNHKQAKKIKVNAGKVPAGMKPKDLMGIPWMLAFALRADGWYLRQDIIWSKPSVMPESVKDRFCKSHEHIFLLSKKPKYYFDHRHALEQATGYDGRKNTVMKGSLKYADKDATGLAQQSSAIRGCERWPKRGYINKEGEIGLNERRQGDNISAYPLRTKRDVWVVACQPPELKHFAMFPQKLILPCILCGCPEGGIVLDPFLGSGTTAVVAVKTFRKYIGCELNPEYIKIAERRIQDEKGLFFE